MAQLAPKKTWCHFIHILVPGPSATGGAGEGGDVCPVP